jgi:two-component system OmpR family sensor kinase
MEPVNASFDDPTAESLAVFNAILRHHVRNHLTVIQGQAQWLDRTVDADSDNIEKITRRCGEMAATIDRIEAITTALSTKSAREPLDLSAFVREEVLAVSDLYDVEVTLDLPQEGPEVLANETLSFALRELLDNAATHAPTAAVTITVDADDTHGYVRVSDDGPGLPDSVAGDPFAHSVRARTVPATGSACFSAGRSSPSTAAISGWRKRRRA